MNIEESVRQLVVKDQIRDAMARYCRGIDRRDGDLVRSAYHEDADDVHGYGLNGSGYDLARIAERDNPEGFPKQWTIGHHFIGNMLIQVEGETAVSETYFQGWARYEHEGVEYDLVSYGRYLDRWERRDENGYLIAQRTVVYDFTRTDAVSTKWPGPDHGVPKSFHGGPEMPLDGTVFGRLDAEDASYSYLRKVAANP